MIKLNISIYIYSMNIIHIIVMAKYNNFMITYHTTVPGSFHYNVFTIVRPTS